MGCRTYSGMRDFPGFGRDPCRTGATRALEPNRSLNVQAPPLAAGEEAMRAAPAAEDRKPEALQGFAILIVDDEVEARALIKAALQLHGAEITETDRVNSALALLTEEHPTRRFDVLVSDIAMPERDGFGLVRDLRAWERSRALRMPALALTGRIANADRQRALDSGFDRHLAKPFDIEELVLVIQQLAFHSRRTH
jgi:two-component system CheB/CheR fusion protein